MPKGQVPEFSDDWSPRGRLVIGLNKTIGWRLALRRPSGYVSPYGLTMFYGAYRANLHFAKKRGSEVSTPIFLWNHEWHPIPSWIMPAFRPFNKYKRTMRGEEFI